MKSMLFFIILCFPLLLVSGDKPEWFIKFEEEAESMAINGNKWVPLFSILPLDAQNKVRKMIDASNLAMVSTLIKNNKISNNLLSYQIIFSLLPENKLEDEYGRMAVRFLFMYLLAISESPYPGKKIVNILTQLKEHKNTSTE